MMCKMTSTATRAQNGEARMTILKRLLKDASPKNPTYILGIIVADFRAQSSTELSVRHGDEVFILFEINDWAFATFLCDSNKKGYVPLDFCEVIKDFYETPQPSTTAQTQSKCLRNSLKVEEATTSQKLKNVAETNVRELAYYETKLKRHSSFKKPLYAEQKVTSKHRTDLKTDIFHKIEHGEDDFSSCYQQKCNLPHCSSQFSNGCTELYAEKTTPTKSHHSSIRADCCCCCEKRKCRSSRQEKYNNVLDYLRDSQPADSHCDDSESGLGDSESIISFSDPHTGQTHIDLNDMSTQTSQSLENLQKQLELISADLDQAANKLQRDRSRKEKLDNAINYEYQSSSDDSTTSSQPSLDSLLSDPIASNTLQNSSESETDDTDQDSNSSFDREDYNTVKRKTSKTEEKAEIAKIEASDSCKQFSSEVPTRSRSVVTQPMKSHIQDRRKLSLPVLENGKLPDQLELTKLSATIKEKLKPTRDELLHCRTSNCHFDISKTVEGSNDCAKNIPSPITITSLPTDNAPADSPSTPHSVEIKQRKMTLQCIQEQYMKLEEARLLHNALKHLNDTMHAREHLDAPSS